jgi:cytidine deaminase
MNERLCRAAQEAAHAAYAPYSRYRVGAAAAVADQICKGANIENASYGATVCAERVALAAARLSDPRAVTELALFFLDAPDDASILSMLPCGICRQWLTELAPDCVIYICQRDRSFKASDLLPSAFQLD